MKRRCRERVCLLRRRENRNQISMIRPKDETRLEEDDTEEDLDEDTADGMSDSELSCHSDPKGITLYVVDKVVLTDSYKHDFGRMKWHKN